MPRKIRITRTSIFEYVPDFDDEFYITNQITTLEQAVLIDRNGVKDGELGPEELCDKLPVVTDIWEIIGDD